MIKKDIKLGDKVKCTITGFEGIAVARTQFINGCTQFDILPKCKDKGKIPEAVSIDKQSLEVIEPPKKKPVKSSTGGPMTLEKKARNY